MDLPSLLMAGSLDTLTSYFSVAFLAIFLPVSVVVYAVIPQKARNNLRRSITRTNPNLSVKRLSTFYARQAIH